MRANLSIVMLLGLLAFLANAVFGGGSEPAEEKAGPGLPPPSAESLPDPSAAPSGPRLDWASWRSAEPTPGKPDPAATLMEPAEESKQDPRLEAVLRNLKNVDVYVERGNR